MLAKLRFWILGTVTRASSTDDELHLYPPDRLELGKFGALKAGMRASRGRCRIFTDAELTADIEYLITLWKQIRLAAQSAAPQALLYQDLSLATRVLRDLVTDMREFFDKWARAKGQFKPTRTRADEFAAVKPASRERMEADAGIDRGPVTRAAHLSDSFPAGGCLRLRSDADARTLDLHVDEDELEPGPHPFAQRSVCLQQLDRAGDEVAKVDEAGVDQALLVRLVEPCEHLQALAGARLRRELQRRGMDEVLLHQGDEGEHVVRERLRAPDSVERPERLGLGGRQHAPHRNPFLEAVEEHALAIRSVLSQEPRAEAVERGDPGFAVVVVETIVENRDRALLPGQYVTMQFVTGERAEALTVPRLIGRARAIEITANAVLPLGAALCEEPAVSRIESIFAALPFPALYGAVRH